MLPPIKKLITTSETTTLIAETRFVKQVVISCSDAGTSWTLKIQDRASSAFTLIPLFTLMVPVDGYPNVNANFDPPVRMDSGIDIVTAGTPGVVSVWISFGEASL